MLKILTSRFLHQTLSQRAAVIACTLVLTGCGGTGAESQQNSTAVTRSSSPQTDMADFQAEKTLEQPQLLTPPNTSQADERARQLFDQLLSPNSDLQSWDEAQQNLLDAGDSAVRVLSEKLEHGSDVEREMAATTLALLGPQSATALHALLNALQDESQFVRANAAAALVQLPEQAQAAVPTLVSLLKADDPQLRQLAAVNLNAAGVVTSDNLDALKQTLNDENSPEVLTPVVELLGRLGRPAQSALPQLQKIAFEQSGELGNAATTAIHLITVESTDSGEETEKTATSVFGSVD